MVKIFRSDEAGNQMSSDYVSEFYITPLAFKKFAGSVQDFLNAKIIDIDSGYPD